MAKYHSGIKSEVSRLATDHAQSLLMLATKCYTELKPTSSQSLSPDATLDKVSLPPSEYSIAACHQVVLYLILRSSTAV